MRTWVGKVKDHGGIVYELRRAAELGRQGEICGYGSDGIYGGVSDGGSDFWRFDGGDGGSQRQGKEIVSVSGTACDVCLAAYCRMTWSPSTYRAISVCT